MLKCFCILFCFSLASIAIGQDGVNGKVCANDNGSIVFVCGANIYVEELDQEFFSDQHGNFQLQSLEENKDYHIVITALGYEDVEMVISGSQFHTLIRLKEENADLPFLSSETAQHP